ncbi:MAG: hypothetical protein JWN96_3102 [Mycobacterium sp.]|nr:hypothetical protein [Mycobacterium sp.]
MVRPHIIGKQANVTTVRETTRGDGSEPVCVEPHVERNVTLEQVQTMRKVDAADGLVCFIGIGRVSHPVGNASDQLR